MKVGAAGGRLQVDPALYQCINNIAPLAGVTPAAFWDALAGIIDKFAPRNKALLEKRDEIQTQLDTWYMQRVGHQDFDVEEHMGFLSEIGCVSV